MKRIFYMMHVPWGWIKQRPHFLAEGLASYFKVMVYYDKPDKQLISQHVSNRSHLSLRTFPCLKIKIPAVQKSIGLLNYYLKKITSIYQTLKSDIIWITFPNQFAHIRHFLPADKTVIYDNMDDALAFYNYNNQLTKLEQELCQRANVIFCSSLNLKDKLIERHQTRPEKIKILNNAITWPIAENKKQLPDSLLTLFSSDLKNIVYIGTIATWMNFDMLIQTLDKVTQLNIILVGPLESKLKIPDHPRLKHHGAIEHDLVFPTMQKADALTMPFVINEIILSVNPVKAYEYIYSGKPVIMVRYPETEKFAEYSYLYSNNNDFLNLCFKLTNNQLSQHKETICTKTFVSENTWNNRINEIVKSI
ncbi:MAG: glycosyltransferase [Marinilabiliaceae bacterium]|nr:glycosyltransferase [Marinilabiliaceae bacterium]